MSSNVVKQFYMDGSQGPLETELHAGHAHTPLVVMCHPHPLYGGSMRDAVLQTAADCAERLGFGWLRFNFRGVGGSAGAHLPNTNPPTETEDLTAAVDWLGRNASERPLIALGYSFGASVVCHSAKHIQVQRQILVAPPNAVAYCPIETSTSPLDIIYGSADDYVDPTAFAALSQASTHELPDTDHFFSGKHHLLAATLTHILTLAAPAN